MTDRAGNLRHRLQLQAPQAVADEAGGSTVTWIPVASMWASLRPLSADEIAAGDGVKGRATHEILLRHRSDVTGAMRFVAGTRVFAIRSAIDPQETGFWLKCLVEEETA